MEQFSLLTLSAVIFGLATFVWRARPDSAINRWFAAYTVSMGLWILGIAGLYGGSHLDFWGRFTFASASLIPANFLAFTRRYPSRANWPSPKILIVIFSIGAVIAVLSLTTPLLVYDVSFGEGGLSRKTGILYVPFLIYFLIIWVAALGVFIAQWKKARGLARAQVQYLGVGLLLSGLGGITVNLIIPAATGLSTHSAIGPYFTLLLVLLVGHAIIRHRLMDLRLIIGRGLALLLAGGLLSAVLIFVIRFGLPAASARSIAMPFEALIIIGVAFITISDAGRKVIARLIDPYLHRGHSDYSTALRQATHRLNHLMQPKQLAAELQAITNDAFVPESFAMTAWREDLGTLEIVSEERELAAPIDLNAVLTLLKHSPSPSAALLTSRGEKTPRADAEKALLKAGVEVMMILGRRGEIFGSVLLGARKSGDAYFTKDLDYIESLAELASISLENALLYRQRIQMLEYSERLLEALDSAVVAVDVTGCMTSFNSAAKSLLGLQDADKGSSLSLLPGEIGWALALAIAGPDSPREIELSIDHKDRGLIPVILSTAVLRDENHNATGGLVVVTDLSTVKTLERNQRRIEHLAMMAQFYAGIAHEIRSPLTSISNFISMLPDRFDDSEYRDTAVRLLPSEVDRIVRLAERLRLMAPSEDGRLTRVALLPLLNDIIALHIQPASDRQITLTLECPNEIPDILGDPGQLIQLFVNLLRNGIEAMPAGGALTIRCIELRQTASVLVEVTDQGVGIEPGLQPKIFQPFFTTKASGTGLGLSICKEIADFHRARLTLFSRGRGNGTVASVEFPAMASDASRDNDAQTFRRVTVRRSAEQANR